MFVIFIIGVAIIAFSTAFGAGENHDGENRINEEEKLGEILSEIGGAGSVSVMISYEEDCEDSEIGRGFGEKETLKKPRGVIVVADGASRADVRSKLKEAAAAVTGVGANRVCVYGRQTN